MQLQPQMPPSKAVGFKPLAEEWNYYSIDDGFVLGVRVVLTKLLKTNQSDPSGLPVYVTQHQLALQVLTQEEYRSITSRNIITK
jgi:hypothetical protein